LAGSWEEKDILITVKTYPEYSSKYTETVCTCGILADTRQMIRIYPIRFRYLDGKNKFSKYQWIKAKIKKAKHDARPESYNINDESIVLGSFIGAGKGGWMEREKWILNDKNIFQSVEDLQAHRKIHNTSLGIVKPKSIMGCRIGEKSPAEMKEAETKKQSIMAQLDMLSEKQDLELLPFRFFLKFNCDDVSCNGHEYSILDWEISALYRKVKGENDWQDRIRNKVLKTICGPKRETHLLIGNMSQHPHIFCILGFFWPPKQRQLVLDFD
jgi:hypothetical protein